jgi:hypothetical protein
LTFEEKQYREFGSDIQSLLGSINLLKEVLQKAKRETNSNLTLEHFRGFDNLNQVVGDFKKTLSDCEKLLSENASFEKENGFVKNIIWNTKIAGDVTDLRERVRLHDIKVNYIFYPFFSKFLIVMYPVIRCLEYFDSVSSMYASITPKTNPL